MIRGPVWFAAGAAAGVYGVVKARRVIEAFTPDGMRDRIGAAVLGARMFAEEVAQGQADAEVRIRQHYRDLEAGRRPAGPDQIAAPEPHHPPQLTYQEGHRN